MSAASDLRAALSPRAADARGPVAIVDIGSNSVRLVIYESQSRNAATLQNEKSICGIGRDMVTTGRLHAEGCAAALEALARFRMICRRLQGRDCARRWRRRRRATPPMARNSSPAPRSAWGSPIRVLAGEDEARIAAEGVVAGIPEASGLAADLGGGSLDMVTVKGGKTGEAWTLPFGPLAPDGSGQGRSRQGARHCRQGSQEYFRPVVAGALCGGRHLAQLRARRHGGASLSPPCAAAIHHPARPGAAAVQGAGRAFARNRCARSRSCPSAAPSRCPMARWCWSGFCSRATSRMW